MEQIPITFGRRKLSGGGHMRYHRPTRPNINTMAKTITPENVRAVSAANIRRLMQMHPDMSSQSALSRASGLPQRTIGRIVNEECTASLEVLVAIAAAFNVGPNYLLMRDR